MKQQNDIYLYLKKQYNGKLPSGVSA